MGGPDPDLAASREALGLITQGLTGALSELGEVDTVGNASVGLGFGELALSATAAGHPELASVFASFCERWDWGVRALIAEGNAFAAGVGLSAGAFHEQEQYISGSFKVLANSMNGDPSASEEDITGKSWNEVLSSSSTDGADWSAGSFEEAGSSIAQSWQDTAYDVESTNLRRWEEAGLIDSATRDAGTEKLRGLLDPTDPTNATDPSGTDGE
jgi:hypothetical protein